MAKAKKSFYSVEACAGLAAEFAGMGDDERAEYYYECENKAVPPTHVRINYLVVAEADRGKGKGRELLHEAIEEAETYKLPIYITACALEPSTDISRLVAFYEKEGFTVEDADMGGEVLMSYTGAR
jgi:GNAT superfamily N-acetyltransferase